MLKITIPAVESYDESKEEFITLKATDLLIEHSLVSLSKWESKWCKPFLSDTDKSFEETIDYISCMTITQNVNPDVYVCIDDSIIDLVNNYIGDPMTATIIFNRDKRKNREIITAELIYYWMIALNIPFECQKWHLNRLLTLINVCNIKNSPSKRMSRRELMARNTELNASRRESLNSKG